MSYTSGRYDAKSSPIGNYTGAQLLTKGVFPV